MVINGWNSFRKTVGEMIRYWYAMAGDFLVGYCCIISGFWEKERALSRMTEEDDKFFIASTDDPECIVVILTVTFR
jgi:hypothetical protein